MSALHDQEQDSRTILGIVHCATCGVDTMRSDGGHCFWCGAYLLPAQRDEQRRERAGADR